MKRIEMDNYNGFSLIEILVAITILCIGLLGMVGLTVGIIYSNKVSNNITTATIVAQNMMEDMQRLGYSGTSSSDVTTTEDYNSISDFPTFKRITKIDVDAPVADLKTITVTVNWYYYGKLSSIILKTFLKK